jgi:hypothetical protein
MSPEHGNQNVSLNEFQARRLSVTCQYIDHVVGEIEQALHSEGSKAAFPRYQLDFTPAQCAAIEDSLAAIRVQLRDALDCLAIPRPDAAILASQAVLAGLTAIDIAAEELRPRYMRGYGEIHENLGIELERISKALRDLVGRLNKSLLQEARRPPAR